MQLDNQTDSEHEAADLSQTLAGSGEDEFVSDEPKAANKNLMTLLGLAIVGVGVVYFMYFKKSPDAADAAIATATDNQAAVTKFLNDGTANIAAMQQMLRQTEKVVEQFRTYPALAQKPLSDLRTNPFRFHDISAEPEDPGMAQRKREEERSAALKAVSTLSLQSVMHSGNLKSCMINNQLYKEGQQVDVFTIDRISPESVIVRSGAYRFELKMQ